MKKISVIMPCYCYADLIGASLEMLSKQTIGMEALQIILVEDCSGDGTLDVLLAFEGRYPESVMVVALPANVGQGAARNIGLSYVEGEYIAFLDQDDRLVDTGLERAYFAAKQYDADVVEFLVKMVEGYGNKEKDFLGINGQAPLCGVEFTKIRTAEEVSDFVAGRALVPMACWNKIYRASLVREHNLLFMEEGLGEETTFVQTMYFYVRRYVKVNEFWYYYLIHMDSTFQKVFGNESKKYEGLRSQLRLLEDLVARGLLAQYPDVSAYFFLCQFVLVTLVNVRWHRLSVDVEMIRVISDTVKAYFPYWQESRYLCQGRSAHRAKSFGLLLVDWNEDNIGLLNDVLGKMAKEISEKGYECV